MNIIFLILTGICMVAVLGTLGTGLVGMARGGEFNARRGNQLMRYRILFQGLALLFFALAVSTSG